MLQDKVSLIKESTYWISGSSKTRCRNQKEYQEKLRELVTDSARRRVNTTSKRVGAELSGGLDIPL